MRYGIYLSRAMEGPAVLNPGPGVQGFRGGSASEQLGLGQRRSQDNRRCRQVRRDTTPRDESSFGNEKNNIRVCRCCSDVLVTGKRLIATARRLGRRVGETLIAERRRGLGLLKPNRLCSRQFGR
jgi:hypothetical protein